MKFPLVFPLVCIVCWMFSLSAQTIDGRPIENIEEPYLELSILGGLFSEEIKLMVRTGRSDEPSLFKQSEINDEAGQAVNFRSAVEVLNFFHQFGYRLVAAQGRDQAGQGYILYRDPDGAEAGPRKMTAGTTQVITGADQLDKYLPMLRGKKVGILGNQTSIVGSPDNHLVDELIKQGVDVHFAFAPEHGFRGNIERGEKVSKDVDTKTGITLHSLYGPNKDARDIVASVDVMIYDLQDVGARFYTYITSLHRLMQLCVDADRPLIVLDRPNPNGDQVNGPVRKSDEFKSNVSYHKIAMVHGLTVGELAHMINGEGWLNNGERCDLTVVPVEGYTHATHYVPPVIPSPSLPNYLSIRLYPSLCLFEGTDISVGRGTDFPFQAIGYPDPVFGDFTFIPGSREGMSAHVEQQGKMCYGMDLRNVNPESFTFNLKHFIDFYQKAPFKDKFFARPDFFDKLAGNDTLRKKIQDGWSYDEIEASWQEELTAYKELRKKYLLYDDFGSSPE